MRPLITVAIMAVPERAEYWTPLVVALNLQGYRPRVALDTDVEGIWPNDKRARRIFGADVGDWHLVLQDDAILCDRFRERLEALVAAAPAREPIALFTRDAAVARHREAVRTGSSSSPYVRTKAEGWFGAVALMMPSDWHEDGIAWIESQSTGDFPRWSYHDDERWASYFAHRGVGVTLAAPCLVEHRELRSMVGHAPGRKAAWFER